MDWLPPLRAPRKPTPKRDNAWRERYEQAYRANFAVANPTAHADHGFIKTSFPPVHTSNGLTMAIINYLNWNGHNADRTGTQGRMIKAGGQWKRIHAANRRGTADISSTIRGRSVKWEVKIGKDKASPEQIDEQLRERRAGGEYFFVKTMGEFFEVYDKLLVTIP